jgi:hypothetical protein
VPNLANIQLPLSITTQTEIKKKVKNAEMGMRRKKRITRCFGITTQTEFFKS